MVYLGVLHTEHWKVGLLFLEAGKNVLCEKPFAMNSKQVKELVAAAKKNNVFLMEVKMKGCSPLGEPYLLFNVILGELKDEIKGKYKSQFNGLKSLQLIKKQSLHMTRETCVKYQFSFFPGIKIPGF